MLFSATSAAEYAATKTGKRDPAEIAAASESRTRPRVPSAVGEPQWGNGQRAHEASNRIDGWCATRHNWQQYLCTGLLVVSCSSLLMHSPFISFIYKVFSVVVLCQK